MRKTAKLSFPKLFFFFLIYKMFHNIYVEALLLTFTITQCIKYLFKRHGFGVQNKNIIIHLKKIITKIEKYNLYFFTIYE